jgi:hypothetical protein
MRGRSKPRTVDEYLAGLSDDKKDALERLRATGRQSSRGASAIRLSSRRETAGGVRRNRDALCLLPDDRHHG